MSKRFNHRKIRIPQMDKNDRSLMLEANPKALEALKEFLSNKNMNRAFLNSDSPIILRALSTYANEYYSADYFKIDCRKTNNFVDLFRGSVKLCFKYNKEYYQGEVVDIKVVKNDSGSVIDIQMTLKTSKMSKTINIDASLYTTLCYINIGDVVYIEPNLGLIKRLGRSETKFDEFDLEGDKYVQLSKGQVFSSEEKTTILSLYDIDLAFNRYNEDISIFTRYHVDSIIKEYYSNDDLSFMESCICFENCHFLNPENLSIIFDLSRQFSFVKIIFSGQLVFSSPVFNNSFFINILNPEKLVNLMKYQNKKLDSDDFYSSIEKLVDIKNYDLILSILETTDSLEEFLSVFHMQKSLN